MTGADPVLLHGRLLQQPGEIEPLMNRVRRMETLTRLVHQWTDAPWLASIRVANLRDDTLVVFSDNASTLTTLRYRREELLQWLRERHGIPVRRLVAKVRRADIRRGV